MQVIELSYEEKIAADCSHLIKVFAKPDLTQTTANTAQTITIPVPAGWAVSGGWIKLIAPFRDPADAALNTTTLSLGDSSSATLWSTARELNANGASVPFAAFTSTVGKAYTAADTFRMQFGSMAAKTLAQLTQGEVHIFVRLVDLTKASS
jgi:hypothetical protein